MRINMKVKVSQHFPKVTNAVTSDVADALYMVAEEIMTDAKTNYVPVVTGNLRRSGFVDHPIINGQNVSVILGFGGAAIQYAVAVHEYPASYGQGKNKYLTKPMNAAAPKIPARIATFMRRMTLGKTTP